MLILLGLQFRPLLMENVSGQGFVLMRAGGRFSLSLSIIVTSYPTHLIADVQPRTAG